jgi:hypothetical protein
VKFNILIPFCLISFALLVGCPEAAVNKDGSLKADRHFDITEVWLDSTSLTLNARPASGSISPGYVVEQKLIATMKTVSKADPPAIENIDSNLASKSVEWFTSDPSRVTVSSGLVSTVADAPEGTASIIVRVVDYPTLTATASVTVTRLGANQVKLQ